MLPLSKWTAAERERLGHQLLERLDRPMAALGVLFLLVVLADNVVAPRSDLAEALTVVGWLLWGAFALEFLLRLALAPARLTFLRRNWWQVAFLLLPFLRFVRVIRAARVVRAARTGRVVSSAVRTTRSAGRRLTDRAAWLAVVTAIVWLTAAQLLFQFGRVGSFATALHATAYATLTGARLDQAEGAFARVLELVLAGYSVVVVASLAGILGAYFLDPEQTRSTP